MKWSVLVGLLGLLALPLAAKADDAIDAKVRDLLKQMTLEEKVGQMVQLSYEPYADFNFQPPDEVKINEAKLAELIKTYQVGSLLNGRAISAENWVKFSRKVQQINLANNRLKVPVLYGIDHMHGASYVSNSTVFPHAFNMAATFDPSLVEAMAHTCGIESADLGHHWIFAPLGDLGVNPQWPRLYETFGEDPYVCGVMAATAVKAIQNNPDTAPYRQAACMKHFLGYSTPSFGGWDRTQSDISDQFLQEFLVPSFKAMIDAGAKTVMIDSTEISGVPVHSSKKILTGLLRDQLGFQGMVVTDWEDIIHLVTTHHVAVDEKEATLLAIDAGIDMAMTPTTTAFFDYTLALVKEGKISEKRIEESAARILRLKYDLGLFEHAMPAEHPAPLRKPESVAKAYQAACESLVLLKNKGVLPLDSKKSIVVTGPNANVKRSLCGGWTLRWYAEPKDESAFPEFMPTVFGAIKKTFDDAKVTLVEKDGLVDAAKSADVIVVVAGEMPYAETPGNITDMTLDADQISLIKQAQSTGKPVVLVMVAGRPRVISDVYDDCAAVLWAGLPGYEGGRAIADVLKGTVNPSGKLSFSYPKQSGVYVPYFYKPSTAANGQVAKAVLAPFGTGLSYTTFKYSDLKLGADKIGEKDTLKATVTVANTGKRAGKEAVLWFLTDEVGRVTRPVRMLKHFEKKEIPPGENTTFTFEIDPMRDLSYPDEHGKRQVEPGCFTITVGDQKARFEYRGE